MVGLYCIVDTYVYTEKQSDMAFARVRHSRYLLHCGQLSAKVSTVASKAQPNTMLLEEKIHELFVSCSGSNGTADFRSISKVLWMCLTNAVSIVDLAGVFTVSVPGNGIEMLNLELFTEFIKAFARLRYPTNPEFCNLVLDEIKGGKSLRANTETPFFATIMDKNVTRILLKYDLALRRAYSNFCGQSVRVGGILNWEEVKNLSIGMEVQNNTGISWRSEH
jgi:hypothetical protein